MKILIPLSAAAVLACAGTARAASIDGEAALSSAFAAQRDLMRAALAPAPVPPKNENPAAQPLPPAEWKALLEKIRAKGKYTPGDQMPATYGLEDVRGPLDAGHTANYINLWGYTASDGSFSTMEVTLVSEYWIVRPDGNWHIDQWIFRLDTDAAIQARAHITLVETPGRRVLEDTADPLKDAEVRIRNKYIALLHRWSGFRPR